MKQYKHKYQVFYHRTINGVESQGYVTCDRFYTVMGKVVTESRLFDNEEVVSSMIIPIKEIIKIMDGDIKCM